MVLNHGTSILFVVLLAFLLFNINCAEPKQQSSSEIRRLVEIETVDAKGVVRERVVAEYKPTESEGQIRNSFNNVRDAKEFLDDDEDSSDNESSGDSETYGESYDMVANDEPMAQSSNRSTPESSGLPSKSSNSSDNSTSIPVTDTVASKTSTVVPTKGQVNASNSSTTTAPGVVQTTENIDTTTVVLQTTKPVTTPAVKVTTTTGKENVTLPSTPSPITVSTEHTQNITTTLLPKVTEVKTGLESTTTRSTSALTLKSTETTRTTAYTVTEATPLIGVSATTKPNFTEEGINNKTDSKVSAKVRTTQSTLSVGTPAVEGRTGSERRKTLFGFVTIEILIALLAGALFSVLLVAFLVYRLKKRNEGSYELSETIALRPKEIDEMGKKKEVFV